MTKWRLNKLINREEYERVCKENRELKKLLLEKHYDDRRKSNFADYLERNLKTTGEENEKFNTSAGF